MDKQVKERILSTHVEVKEAERFVRDGSPMLALAHVESAIAHLREAQEALYEHALQADGGS